MPQQRLAGAVLVGVRERINALDPVSSQSVWLRFGREQPESATCANRVSNRCIRVVRLLEEALVTAHERFGKLVRTRRVERQKLALDLVKP
jgi:hypothetical protein